MKFLTLALVAAGSVALFANGNTSSATAEVSVKIVAPILVSNVYHSNLDFGAVTVDNPTQPIAVTYNPTVNGTGVASYTNCDPYANKGQNGPSSFAWFHIRKDHFVDWSAVNIAVDPIVQLGDGVKVATKNSPLSECSVMPLLKGQTSKDEQHFYVGGTLTAPAETFGNFHGQMKVTVAYQ